MLFWKCPISNDVPLTSKYLEVIDYQMGVSHDVNACLRLSESIKIFQIYDIIYINRYHIC